MRTVLMILLVSGLPLGTCIQPPAATPCTALFAYGVNATVTDAVTATAITDATLTLTEGSYTEVMQHFPTGDYVGAGGPAVSRRGVSGAGQRELCPGDRCRT